MSRDFVQYDAVTHDEYLRRWREQHDLCVAFFDPDRAERHLDFEPAPRTPTPSCARAVPAVVPTNTAGPTGTAGEAHGDTSRLASTPTPNRRAA